MLNPQGFRNHWTGPGSYIRKPDGSVYHRHSGQQVRGPDLGHAANARRQREAQIRANQRNARLRASIARSRSFAPGVTGLNDGRQRGYGRPSGGTSGGRTSLGNTQSSINNANAYITGLNTMGTSNLNATTLQVRGEAQRGRETAVEMAKGAYGQLSGHIGSSLASERQAAARAGSTTQQAINRMNTMQPNSYIDQVYGRHSPGYMANLANQQTEVSNLARENAAQQTNVMDQMVAQGRADIDQTTETRLAEKQNYLNAVGAFSQQGMNFLSQQFNSALEQASAFGKSAKAKIDELANDQIAQAQIARSASGFQGGANTQQVLANARKLESTIGVDEKVATLKNSATQAFTQGSMNVLSQVLGGQEKAAQWGDQIASQALDAKTALGKMSAQSKVQTLANLGSALTNAANAKYDKTAAWFEKNVVDKINFKKDLSQADIARANMLAGLDIETVRRANDNQRTALEKLTDKMSAAFEKESDIKVASIQKYNTDYLRLITDIARMRTDLLRTKYQTDAAAAQSAQSHRQSMAAASAASAQAHSNQLKQMAAQQRLRNMRAQGLIA
tara:strand:- start:1204 stop:2892 length:1689 start_codon:yes stop_codon:yes gene_type:complete